MTDAAIPDPVTPPAPREYPGINWAGFKTLYLREVMRFWKVATQTLAAPVITVLLYMLVFVVAAQGIRPPVHGTPFATFIAPGLIMMSILNNAFANSSSSLIQAKQNGQMGDFLTPPLTPMELVAAFTLGAVTRGVLVGAVTAVSVLPFAKLGLAHLWAVLFFGLGAAIILSALGIMTALWADRFDQMSAISNFVIMPLTFLSGTFYLVDRLPEPFRSASHFNPFFYLIDGFRYGFIGHAEGSLWVGAGMTLGLAILCVSVCLWMFESGYKIKS
jgi:ABC-2 type transport system permease protein